MGGRNNLGPQERPPCAMEHAQGWQLRQKAELKWPDKEGKQASLGFRFARSMADVNGWLQGSRVVLCPASAPRSRSAPHPARSLKLPPCILVL